MDAIQECCCRYHEAASESAVLCAKVFSMFKSSCFWLGSQLPGMLRRPA